MKISVNLSEKEMKQILHVVQGTKKGPAIRQLTLEALMLKKRRNLSDQVLKGEWSIRFDKNAQKNEDRSSWAG